MKYIDINTIDPEARRMECIHFEVEGMKCCINIAEQKTGYGVKHFFVCPECGERRVKLYFVNAAFKCAKCAKYNPYKRIQNGTKGGYSEIGYRMERIAAKIGIKIEFPFDYIQFANDPRLRKESFREKLTILQALENIRFQNIFFKTIYPARIIRMIETGKHPLLKYTSLHDLRTYAYKF